MPKFTNGDGFVIVFVMVSYIVGSRRSILSSFGSKPLTHAVYRLSSYRFCTIGIGTSIESSGDGSCVGAEEPSPWGIGTLIYTTRPVLIVSAGNGSRIIESRHTVSRSIFVSISGSWLHCHTFTTTDIASSSTRIQNAFFIGFI